MDSTKEDWRTVRATGENLQQVLQENTRKGYKVHEIQPYQTGFLVILKKLREQRIDD